MHQVLKLLKGTETLTVLQTMSAATGGEAEDADSLVKMDLIRRKKLKSPTKVVTD